VSAAGKKYAGAHGSARQNSAFTREDMERAYDAGFAARTKRFVFCFFLGFVLSAGVLFWMRRPIYDPRASLEFDPDIQAIRLAQRPANPKLVFLGDSIAQRWEYRPQIWSRFAAYDPANFGAGGDRVPNVIWRVENGALDGIHPDFIVLLVGTNDVSGDDPAFYRRQNPTAGAIAAGEQKLLAEIHEKQPQSRIILMGLFPRRNRMRQIEAVNNRIRSIPGVTYLNIDDSLSLNGEYNPAFTIDGVHLTDAGYAIWADRLLAVISLK
jgi:lysophospholipase L1-like esterase